MKIHYLATANVPSKTANSLQIIKMCEAFSKLNHNVKLIVPNFNGTEITAKKYYDIKTNFKIIKIGKKIQNISKINNVIIPIKIFFKSLMQKPDLVVTRNFLICILLVFFRQKHILEIHDDIDSSGKIISKLFKFFNILNSKKILKLIFISDNLKNFIKHKYNYSKKKIKILPDASDIKVNTTDGKIKKKSLSIGYFGSIYQSRGINLILDLSRIDKKNKYYVFGGSKKEHKNIRKYNVNNNLFFHEQIPFVNVKKEIEKMDLLLMPYTKKATVSGDYGNIIDFMSPMKMFDYLASGKIIISADLKVLREVLKHNYNAIMVRNYQNKYSWIREINKINLFQSKYILIKKNALHTSKLYTWENRAKQMLD